MAALTDPNYFADFARTLARSGTGAIHAGEIGRDLSVPTRDGALPLLYADYTATGRALRQVEEAVMTDVLPWYANSHSRQSLCGRMMNAGRAAARAYVAEQIGAGADCAVIFTGSGATAGINRLVHLFGLPAAVAAGRPVRVILGPWEHHSNILPWRESGAEVIALPEARTGGPCAETLDRVLADTPAGTLAVVLVAGLQAAGLAALSGSPAGCVLAGACVLGSRVSLATCCARPVPPARPEGLGATVAGTVPVPAATLTWLVLAVALTGLLTALPTSPTQQAAWHAAAAVVVAAGLTLLLVRRCTSRLGGVTGDVLGAGVETSLAVLLLAPA